MIFKGIQKYFVAMSTWTAVAIHLMNSIDQQLMSKDYYNRTHKNSTLASDSYQRLQSQNQIPVEDDGIPVEALPLDGSHIDCKKEAELERNKDDTWAQEEAPTSFEAEYGYFVSGVKRRNPANLNYLRYPREIRDASQNWACIRIRLLVCIEAGNATSEAAVGRIERDEVAFGLEFDSLECLDWT